MCFVDPHVEDMGDKVEILEQDRIVGRLEGGG